MKPKQTILPLFAALIALVIGSKEWVAYHWNELSADAQIKWALGGSSLLICVLIYYLKPLIIHLFM